MKSSGIIQGTYASIPGMDPRADWLLANSPDFLPEGALVPFILVLHEDLKDVARLGNALVLPSIYQPLLLSALRGGVQAFAPRKFFDELDKGDFEEFRNARKEIRLCSPLPWAQPRRGPGEEPKLEKPPLGPPPGGWPTGKVVMGIIDDGIAFANERFRDPTGRSRVQCAWRQDGPEEARPSVDYGREICKSDKLGGAPGIDRLLLECQQAGQVDEDWLYARARLIDSAEHWHKTAAWRIAHGTHVLDLAAGLAPAKDKGTRPIVAVQLPVAVTANTSSTDLADQVIHAVDYILDRAGRLAGNGPALPVVIVCSYGTVGGPHDGTSLLEHLLDERIKNAGGKLRIVLSAGNSHLSRCHAEVRFNKADYAELTWHIQPGDRTESAMEIWLPWQASTPPPADRIQVSLVTPDGVATTPLGEHDGAHVELSNNGVVVGMVSYRFMPERTERGVFHLHLQPTARLHPDQAGADRFVVPPGRWKVRIRNILLDQQQPIQAWIWRDDTIYGYPPLGRQAYFDEPCYWRFFPNGREVEEDADQPDCRVKRARLLSAIATGEEVLVAGAYRRKERGMAPYSAGGPVTPPRGSAPDPAMRKPDASLVGEDSKVHFGRLGSGSRSNSVVPMGGTSVAAPQLARWVADHISPAGILPDRTAVKAAAQAGAPGPPLPPDRGGWGRIELPPIVKLDRYWP